jgi:hypothetical protein
MVTSKSRAVAEMLLDMVQSGVENKTQLLDKMASILNAQDEWHESAFKPTPKYTAPRTFSDLEYSAERCLSTPLYEGLMSLEPNDVATIVMEIGRLRRKYEQLVEDYKAQPHVTVPLMRCERDTYGLGTLDVQDYIDSVNPMPPLDKAAVAYLIQRFASHLRYKMGYKE